MLIARKAPLASLAVFGVLTVSGCSESGESSTSTITEVDSAGVTVVTIAVDAGALPHWSVGSDKVFEISGNAEPFLGSVGELEFLSDGSLLVEDEQARSLLLFDPMGQLVRRVGDRGEGPGQFENIAQLGVTQGDTAYVFDRRLGRISVFGREGDLLRTIPIAREEGGPGAVALNTWALSSDDQYLHRASPYDTANAEPRPRRDQRDAVLTHFRSGADSGLGEVRFAGSYSIDYDGGDGPAPFSSRPLVEAKAGRVYYGSGIEYEVVVADSELTPLRVVRWPRINQSLTDDDIEAARDSILSSFGPLAEQAPDIVARILEATFAPAVVPEVKPALGDIFVDENGRMWLADFVPFTQPWGQENVWTVFSHEGHPVARVTLPPRAKLGAVLSDRVAIVRADEFDVEHVVVVRLIEQPD